MLHNKTIHTLSWLSIITFALLFATPTHADTPILEDSPNIVNITLLGDSFSAGNGAGAYDESSDTEDDKTYRSWRNWGNEYVNWLNGRTGGQSKVFARLTNLSHSGHTTSQLTTEQVDDIPPDTDLVMFSITGNDAGFGGAVTYCLAVAMRSAQLCRAALEEVRTYVRDPYGLEADTYRAIAATDAKLSALRRNKAQIILMGYGRH